MNGYKTDFAMTILRLKLGDVVPKYFNETTTKGGLGAGDSATGWVKANGSGSCDKEE